MELVKINASDYGIEEKKATELTKGLDTILKERDVLITSYNDVIELEITEETIPTFKELRLLLVKNRTQGIEQWKKVNKAYFLAVGNFIQATYNKEVAENERMEETLKNAEKHFENLEKERIEKLQSERELELQKYNVENIESLNLGIMSDEIWSNFLSGTKVGYENKIAAEKKAEEDRIAAEKAEKERQEAIEKENTKLKKEAEAKEKQLEKERLEREQKEALRIESERKEKEAEEKKRLEEQRIANEKLEVERKEREKVEAELRATLEAEEKAEKERVAKKKQLEEEAAKLAKAPIKKQLKTWVDSFSLGKPVADNETTQLIEDRFESFRVWAKAEIEKI